MNGQRESRQPENGQRESRRPENGQRGSGQPGREPEKAGRPPADQAGEERHLRQCLEIIEENISAYEKKEREYQREVTELYQSVKKGEGDSYGLLIAGRNILEHTQNALRKNRAALKKAYFGRIDYEDRTFGVSETCYIGKNGITRNQTEVVIVDWRAPAANVYYENELGEGSYDVPGSGAVTIRLDRKRTYDVDGRELLGFYDDDVAANDELLVKYLSQNKEAVLGDIIATIQKEQNEIIRDIPYKNMIVQGVAGSGKTTVALHRISYLLYNYDKEYKPSEFCIVGSSDMLLNYISSGLPELDVSHVRQMRMDKFVTYLMGKAWKKKFKLTGDNGDAPKKSRLAFAKRLEEFLERRREESLGLSAVADGELGVIFTEGSLREAADRNRGLSLLQLEKLLNNRIAARIRFLCTGRDENFKKGKLAEYRKYFDFAKYKWTETQIYLEFLESLEREEGAGFLETAGAVRQGRFDLYDAAAMALIWKRVLLKKETDEFSQIIIDEAQDFGEMLYYVIRRLLPGCYFTVMGDVSQNIRYETGMNDWEGLKEAMFEGEKDSFYVLAKSYRNTIEISGCAGRVLEHASQGAYQIQPVIRHGRPVEERTAKTEELAGVLKAVTDEVRGRGFETIAVICRSGEEAEEVRGILELQRSEPGEFKNGVMVLPVSLTKGLEFDAVILWKPDAEHYGVNKKDAKLLYVAITRALHELWLVGDREKSPLFEGTDA